jgi:DinB superfamily
MVAEPVPVTRILDTSSTHRAPVGPGPGVAWPRPRGTAVTSMAAGADELVIDWAYPEPTPAPVTTIAWRLGHVIVGVLGMRNAAHFGRGPVDYATSSYAATAAGALAQLDSEVTRWLEGVRRLGDEGLERPCGHAEGPFADAPMATLVLHIHRELIHHLAEVSLLRDLYRHTAAKA